MQRRRFLTVVTTSTTAGVVGLAGCGSPGGDGGDGTPGGGGGTPGDETPTEAGTPGDGTATGDGTEGTSGGGGTDAQGVTVDMITDGDAYYFDPIGVAVPSGDAVTWINDSGSHSATAYTEDNPQSQTLRIPENADGWDSGILSEQGAEFSHTFETEGTYDYYCTPHKSQEMVGRVVVGAPGGPGDEGQPPDGALPASTNILKQGEISYQDFQG